MKKDDFLEYEYDKLSDLFDGRLILLVTVTEIETSKTRSVLTALDSFNKVLKVSKGNYTYYIGKFGKYGVALVQSGGMGSISANASIITIKTALDTIKSSIVIMIGIAFGIDEIKQNIGDVLISETIIPYNSKRVGEEKNIQRGMEKPASTLLLNRLKNVSTWEYLLEDGVKAKSIFTKILSGEELIDNKSRRDELVSIYPEAKGGEMEGVGVSSACDGIADWILIKGICDFADGQKSKEKKKRQYIAIESALSLCMELFNSDTAFKDKGIIPYSENGISRENSNAINYNNILFEVYDPHKEPYYLERKEDIEFNQKISQYGIWVYGDTGSGKSNLILRNLIKNQSNYISIILGACVGQKNIVLFNEILNCIQEKTGNNSTYPNHKTFPICCKAIKNELEYHFKGKEIVIYIDEIPINSNTEYKQFVISLFALINAIQLTNGLGKVKFILSSIHNPITHIARNDQKIHQYLYFLPLKYWESADIESLIKLIKEPIQCNLPQPVQTKLIKQANGSPRFVKKYFKNVLLNEDRSQSSLFQKIIDTESELKQSGNA